MLVSVDLFILEVIVAPELGVASSHGVGSFQQVVAEETVAGLDESGVLGLKSPDWCCVQTRPANLATDDWD